MPKHRTMEPTVETELHTLDNSATITLLEQWALADATDDKAVIAQADRDLAEFMASLNAKRAPDRPIFP